MAVIGPDERMRVLVVEDAVSYRDALMSGLTNEGYAVELAADAMEGLRKFTARPPDIVLLDVLLPGRARRPPGFIVLRRPLSESTRALIGLWTGCVAGALVDEDYQAKLRVAGFENVSIEPTKIYGDDDISALAVELSVELELPEDLDRAAVQAELSGSIMSAFVRGQKLE